ncbi:MAG: orotate phosphoribosyltransferase [Dehalococcoidales bacterium]|nr:orotate phosphoribosyltransferase [Dehalococcoidales bacterium]
MTTAVEELFEKSGAVLKGHFLLSSGLHSPVYWEKFQVLQYPRYTQELCRMIAEHYRDSNIQVVAGPTTGGIILSFETARQLGLRGIFAEKKEGSSERAFRRGFAISPGERVLLVDDILTTGGSVRETIDAINKLQGHLVGVAVMVDRSTAPLDFGVPLFSCLRTAAVTYKPDRCPLCAAGLPLIKRGSS